jgi:hypothetical protein
MVLSFKYCWCVTVRFPASSDSEPRPEQAVPSGAHSSTVLGNVGRYSIRFPLQQLTTGHDILDASDALLAGSTAAELQASVSRLPIMEVHSLLCSACWMRNDIASNCAAYGAEVDKLLARNCGIYAAGVRAVCSASSRGRKSSVPTKFTNAHQRAVSEATV